MIFIAASTALGNVTAVPVKRNANPLERWKNAPGANGKRIV
jgi:hypothetical protein